MSDPLSTSVAENLRSVFMLLEHRALSRMKPVDMTPARFRVLFTLHESGPARMSDLSRRLNIVPRSLTDNVVPLERMGLVRRERDAEDGRALVVSLTPEGQRVHDELKALFFQSISELLVVLDDQEKQDLNGLLRAIVVRQEA